MEPLDPVVAALAWLITYVLGRTVGVRWPLTRGFLPVVAVLAAVFLYTGVAAVQDEPLTQAAVLRGLLAGAAAVLAHSQWREVVKWTQPPLDGSAAFDGADVPSDERP